MKIRIGDYRVEILDADKYSKEECIEAAKDAVKQIKDATLERSISTNVSFSPVRMKEAIQNADTRSLRREYEFLRRDMEADAKDNANYVKMYRPETLDKIISQYEKAIKLLESSSEFELNDLVPLNQALYQIRKNWGKTKEVFTATVIGADGTDYSMSFDDFNSAKKYVDDMIKKLEKTGVDDAMVVETAETGEVLYIPDLMIEQTKVNDVPYYEPTESPVIKSDYSIERLQKEIAHPEKEAQDLRELKEVLLEIDELAAEGTQALVDAGWTRQDARQAIANKYYVLLKNLRRAGLKEESSTLRAAIKKLEKAWDLTR